MAKFLLFRGICSFRLELYSSKLSTFLAGDCCSFDLVALVDELGQFPIGFHLGCYVLGLNEPLPFASGRGFSVPVWGYCFALLLPLEQTPLLRHLFSSSAAFFSPPHHLSQLFSLLNYHRPLRGQ